MMRRCNHMGLVRSRPVVSSSAHLAVYGAAPSRAVASLTTTTGQSRTGHVNNNDAFYLTVAGAVTGIAAAVGFASHSQSKFACESNDNNTSNNNNNTATKSQAVINDSAVKSLPRDVAAAASAAHADGAPTNVANAASIPAPVAPAVAAATTVVAPAVQRAELTPGVLQVNERGSVSARTLEKFEKRFMQNATVERDGEHVMSPEDFLRSMLPNASQVGEKDKERVRMFFNMADMDNDGTLSFSEYVTFFTLLSRPAAEFKIAFKLFDLNNDGYIEKCEFDKVIGTSSFGAQLGSDTAFTSHFFGPDGSKKLTYPEFKVLLQELTDQVLKLEFKQFDRDSQGTIAGDDFLKLITQHSDVTSVPGWLQQNLMSSRASRVSYDQFIAVNHIIQHIKQVETAIRMYTAAGGHIDKERFKRAVSVSTGWNLAQNEVDVLFTIFDRNGKGYLDHDSFIYLMSNRAARDLPSAKPVMSLTQSFVLGGMSAMVGASCVYPMDKIKTRIQSSIGATTVMAQVRDIGTTFRGIFLKEGFFGLYKGLPAQLVGIVPEKALKITVNDYLKRQIKKTKSADAPDLTLKDEALAGFGTGLVQVFVSTPYELVKIRMQMQTPDAPKKSPVAIIRELGFRGMFQGLPATLLRDVPFNIIYFTSYAGFKQLLKDDQGNLSATSLFAAGLAAGALGAGLDTPADCLKTRLQNGKGHYKGLRDAATTMWREEGHSAFLKGLAPRILIIAPLFSITFMVFEYLQRTLLPHMRAPLQTLEEDFSIVRESRLRKMTHLLESEFGLSVNGPRPL